MTSTINAAVDTQIHSRALLVWLSISTWSARKYDKKISEKVNHEYHASSDAGRYNKFLLPGDCAAYKSLVSTASAIRAQHYSHTLAWSDEGWRLLPTANYMDYAAWFREQQRKFRDDLDSFISDYPMMKERARALLNGMYKDADYPDTQDIRSRFSLSLEYSPLPAFGDVRVDLSSDQIAAVEANIQTRADRAVKIAVDDSWSRLHKIVSAISERLTQPDAIFRDSLIENAHECCAVMKKLNVTNDPDLERMRLSVETSLTMFAPDILRKNKAVRESVAQKADAIMKSMAAFYQPSK